MAEKKPDFDDRLASVTRELDERLAARILVRLGLMFNWSLASATRAIPIVMAEIGHWYEPEPTVRKIGPFVNFRSFPLLKCDLN